MKRIESRDNKTYRQLTSLRQNRHSRKEKLFFLEGFRLCEEAVLSGLTVVYALVADSAVELPQARKILGRLAGETLLLSLPDRLFNDLCETENPQGLALICQSRLLESPAGLPDPKGLYLVAEEIQDPGNLGTMIRTADAFGFDGVILTAGTVYPYNEKVLRSAMGSCFHIPLLVMKNISAVAEWLAGPALPIPMLAADPGGTDTTLLPGWPVPSALVIGNEARGLSAKARQLCTRLVRIPMPGRAESLNAAAASAILCYELMRARLSQPL